MSARASLMLLWLFAPGCGRGTMPPERPPPGTDRVVVFRGTCDASGAIPVDGRRFALGDDEDNVLRLYEADRGGFPLDATDVTRPLGLVKRTKRGRLQPLEADIEAATRLGDTALWLTSHGRRKSGKASPERLFLFATTIPARRRPITVRGQPYRELLQDLVSEPRLAPFRLAEAAARPPQQVDGLNLEGMTATPEGGVLLGFRSPIRGGRALLLPLLNPLELGDGQRARFGEPVALDLGGLGVRSLSHWRGRYLLLAGHVERGSASRLFTWEGPGAPAEPVAGVDLDGLNPEAFFTPESRDEILLLSDDGERLVDGEACKRLEDPQEKSFRGVWLRLAGAVTSPGPPRTVRPL